MRRNATDAATTGGHWTIRCRLRLFAARI